MGHVYRTVRATRCLACGKRGKIVRHQLKTKNSGTSRASKYWSQQCSEGKPSNPLPMDDENADVSIFDDLTQPEMKAVIAYLVEHEGIEQHKEQVTSARSFIYMIEGLPPAKSEAVAYLDRKGPRPLRYAKAVLYRGDKNPPVISELKVGPLPLPTSHEVIEHPGWNISTISYHLRSFLNDVELQVVDAFLSQKLSQIDNILQQETGYRYNNCSTNCLLWLPSTPGSFQPTTRRKFWISLLRAVEGTFLHPIGFQMKIDMEPVNTDKWHVMNVWFKGQYFDSLDEFMLRYTPSEKPPKMYDSDDPNLYSSLKQRGPPLPSEPQRGPQQVLPDGRRWTVNGHHVTWQGWSFDFNMRSHLGTQLHDVRFQEHKVAYEVSLSEIGIMYSGFSPLPLHTAYMDSFVGLGRVIHVAVPGGDCPDFASYFDFVHYTDFAPTIYEGAVCLFEWNTGVPLRRHYDTYMANHHFYQSMPDNVLILRSMITVGNYEYLLDYTFHQNGVLEVKCSLSGYVLASYYTGAQENKYGFEIFPDGIGNIHNHLVHFKVDLDVDGATNRFESLDVSVEAVDDVTEPGNPTILARTVTRNTRKTERDGAVKLNAANPQYLLMVNNNSSSAYGNKRSYRIIPRDTTIVMLPEGADVEEAFTWARYQVAITRQRDSEVAGSNMYATMSLLEPTFKFQDFIDDDEDIVDQDLVAWVTLGALHIPHSEDVPIVQTPGVQLSFLLQPYNFFQEDPSLRSRDNIRSTPRKGGGRTMEYVGVRGDASCDPPPSTGNTYHNALNIQVLVTFINTLMVI